jgi:carbonic anhydrase/acetyltransferase-like protein (isoleucine patch superfamily)
VVFNGARIETGAEIEFHAVVYINTTVPAGVAVPIGWPEIGVGESPLSTNGQRT